MHITKQNAETLLSWFRRYEGEEQACSVDWALAVQLKHAAGYPADSIRRAEEHLLEALKTESEDHF